MDDGFLLKLDKFRELLGHTFIITSDYADGGHATNSQHYRNPCKCIDGHGLNLGCRIPLVDLFLAADKVGFNGIGLYYPNRMIHLDDREIVNGKKARWIGIEKVNDKGKKVWDYIAMSPHNFKEYCI